MELIIGWPFVSPFHCYMLIAPILIKLTSHIEWYRAFMNKNLDTWTNRKLYSHSFVWLVNLRVSHKALFVLRGILYRVLFSFDYICSVGKILNWINSINFHWSSGINGLSMDLILSTGFVTNFGSLANNTQYKIFLLQSMGKWALII